MARALQTHLAAACVLLLGCKGRISEPPDRDFPKGADFRPAPLGMSRLLSWQYRLAVADLAGDKAAAAVAPPPDGAINGLTSLGARSLSLSATEVAAYEASAQDAAQAAVADPSTLASLLPCTPSGPGDSACAKQTLEKLGARAFRRPLAPDELTDLQKVAAAASAATADFNQGIAYALSALMQSPSFLYQVTVGSPDGAHPGFTRLSGPELATRMSFLLTGGPPDDELSKAAKAGALDSSAGRRTQARRLLATPRAQAALLSFFKDVFDFSGLDGIQKDTTAYPAFSPALARDMREENQRLITDLVFTRNTDFREVLTAPYAFVSAPLATLYGLTGAPAQGFGRVDLPADSGRAGLLGQALFLSIQAHPLTTSPTHRGRFVLENLLCQSVPSPPPNVPQLPLTQDPSAPQTLRQKLTQHLANPACSGCHQLMDPVGFGFEHFDAIGAYRAQDQGLPIDATGTVAGQGTFDGEVALSALLAKDPRFTACLMRNLYRNAVGHVETTGETASLQSLQDSFAKSSFHVQDALVELVASPPFRYGKAE